MRRNSEAQKQYDKRYRKSDAYKAYQRQYQRKHHKPPTDADRTRRAELWAKRTYGDNLPESLLSRDDTDIGDAEPHEFTITKHPSVKLLCQFTDNELLAHLYSLPKLTKFEKRYGAWDCDFTDVVFDDIDCTITTKPTSITLTFVAP
jgi:hypothetical protein